jgi:chromate transporter
VVILGLGLLLWFSPVVVAALLLGRSSIFVDQGVFFSGAAVVTFGAAYAVLAYVAQQAVNVYGWLAPGEMVRGLALAETTPGPLIMVVQFVAFVGAYRVPGSLDPWVAAVMAALLTTWVTSCRASCSSCSAPLTAPREPDPLHRLKRCLSPLTAPRKPLNNSD